MDITPLCKFNFPRLIIPVLIIVIIYSSFFLNESTADRVVLRADVVRDHLGMCYDVANCVPRAVNETWNIGPCAVARCEKHDNGMLIEVRMMCPRFHKHIRAKCDYIEDMKLSFPDCCPHTICKKDKIQEENKEKNTKKKAQKDKMALHHLPDSPTTTTITTMSTTTTPITTTSPTPSPITTESITTTPSP